MFSKNNQHLIGFVFGGIFLLGCGGACVSKSVKNIPLNQELPTELTQEYKKKFEVKETKESPIPPENNSKKKHPVRASKKDKKQKEPFAYISRRPAKDPIWVGEKFTYSISYFGIKAGDLILETMPYKLINNRKVYHVRGLAHSSALFSLFYRLDDMVETFFDYEGLFSHRFHVLLDETKQERDSLELNDSEKKQTFYWNRWNHKEKGYSEVRTFGTIKPFPQDSVSALYYLRTIPLTVGAEVSVPLVSEGKNLEAVCKVLRREEIKSPLGKVQALVLQPDIKYEGVLKKAGESFLWLSDDDRKIPLRLEAKVRVGTVTATLKEVELGTPPQVQSLGNASEKLETVKTIN